MRTAPSVSERGGAASCPKAMTYGPCGGVALNGTCEVAPHPCVFLGEPTIGWHGVVADEDAAASGATLVHPIPADPVPAPHASERADWMRARLGQGRVVVADLPARALDAASLAEVAGILSGRVDAVLAGDSGAARVQFSPTYRAHLLRAAGLDVWTGLNCRDRNRVALEGELAGLADVGAAGIHSVTGDHTLTGHRPDAMPVFDLDSTELASLARAAGHLVSVAEAPATPPVGRRPARLAEKIRAGGEVCFVDHCGGVGPVRDFVAAAQDAVVAAGIDREVAFIPCIPIVVDRGSAELLASFTSLVLPDGYLERILSAADPLTEGIAAAIELSERMLEIPGVRGVDLSGGPTPGREAWFAEALARIGEGLA